jgi:hypothetical protein
VNTYTILNHALVAFGASMSGIKFSYGMLKTKLAIHKEKVIMNKQVQDIEKLTNKYADVNKEFDIKLMSDEEVKEAALKEKLINDNPIIDNPKEEIIIKENNNNNIIIDNDNIIKDNNIISTSAKDINTNLQPKTIDLNKAKILSVGRDFIQVDYKGQKYTINLGAISEEQQVVVKIKAVTMKINELRVKFYDESNLVEMRKINAELNHLAEKFSNYWNSFDLIKNQAETSMGAHMSNLEFLESKMGNNVIGDLNNYVKVMDGDGNIIINYGQSKTFKISNGMMQEIDVKITSEYGMPMDKQPTNWEEIRGSLKKFNEAYNNMKYLGNGGELEAYIIDENAISSIELDVPMDAKYGKWCSGKLDIYKINVKIHLNDGTTLTDTYTYGYKYKFGYDYYFNSLRNK